MINLARLKERVEHKCCNCKITASDFYEDDIPEMLSNSSAQWFCTEACYDEYIKQEEMKLESWDE